MKTYLKIYELKLKTEISNNSKSLAKQIQRKWKNGEVSPVYFNSTTKTVIIFEYGLDKSFQKILYIIDNWINEGSR